MRVVILGFFTHWSGYAENSHERMKRIFTILTTFDTVRDHWEPQIRSLGEEIHCGGGTQAMAGCFYAFFMAILLIHQEAKDDQEANDKLCDIRWALRRIWDGVGEWKP